MIITNSKDQKANFPAAKQEATSTGDKEKLLMKAPNSSSTSTRQWSSAGFRNPRIVRVSRTFGGKDRHSKVCTVRGLRDRRIRLSVPTAVQLYDLQDRLGLSQPSKVIDWLIDATNTDIDKLPPLQFPQGALIGQFHHQHLLINPDLHHDPIAATTSTKSNLVHDQQDHQFVQKLFGMPSYLNYYHSSSSSDHHRHQPSPNLSLSQLGLGQFSLPQLDLTSHGSNSSSSSLSSSSSSLNPQLFFCAQPNYSATPLFGPYPQYITDHHHQQINHDHSARTSSSSSSSSQIMNQNSQNIQFLTSSSQQNHALSNNYSLMSSLHNSNAEDSPHNLIKSFPAILNPRLFSQSILDQNRQGKGPT